MRNSHASFFKTKEKEEENESKRLVFGYLDIRRFLTHNDRR